MSQPVLGLVASAIVMAISLAYISLFDFATFVGSVSFFMLCLIPFQIIVVVLWGASPPFAAPLRQPGKGLMLILVTMIAAAIIAPLALQAVGEGVRPPGPIPSHFVTAVVPTTFWLAIMMGGWPFTTVTRHPILSGLLTLVAAYLVTYAVFRLAFNYDFLQGAPVHLASAPNGLHHAVLALVFYVTALAAMFLMLCFDLWPLTRSPSLMTQPVLGVVWTAVALAIGYAVMFVGVDARGMDPMIFLTRVTVPFIFGSIIVLNMLQNSLFATMTQPLKGVANTMAVIAIGLALANLYGVLAPSVTGALPSGAPGYEYEIWLANSLLSVTFPFLIFYAAYFNFWPLVKGAA